MANSRSSSIDVFDSFSPGPISPRGDSPYTNHEWMRKSASGGRSQRRESVGSIASSVGGSLDISIQGRLGKAAEASEQNAIATLLQQPIVRTGLLPHTAAPASAAQRLPSTRDIPPVTLTNIPHVEPSAFAPYLSQVGSLYHVRQQAEPEQSSQQWTRRERRGSHDDAPGYFDSTSNDKASRLPSRGSLSAVSAIEAPAMGWRRSGGGVRRSQLTVAPLSSIPTVYFDDNFHLENPRTFDVVTERSEVIRTPQPTNEDGKVANGSANGVPVAPRKALSTNAILQEKLSWYLDTVEIHLISSISAASKSFFAALGSLKELHSEAADSVVKIQKIREDLEELDRDMAQGRLEIMRLRQRRQNIRKLADATQQMQNVIKGASQCEEMVEQGEFEGSLDRISVLEEYTCGQTSAETVKEHTWLFSEPPGFMVDMRRLRALEGFGDGMNRLRGRIGAGYQSRFMEALLSDLRQHVGGVPNQQTLTRWASASQRARGIHISTGVATPAYMSPNSGLREMLSSTLVGLKRSKFTTAATATFREAVNKEMKAIIRHNLPSSTDDDSESVTSISTRSSRAQLSQQEKSAILARNLRQLGPDDAEELLTRTYCAVGEALRRLQFQFKLLLDVSSDAGFSPTMSPVKSHSMKSLDASLGRTPPIRSQSPNLQQEISEALDLSSLLGQAVDVAQSQIIKVLKVRGEQSARLSLPQFLRYFTLNRLFADECEAVSGRSGAALKGVINNQISDFIPLLAESERQSLAHAMEADRWDAKDFNEKDTETLNTILQGMTSDPPSYLKQAYIWESLPQSNGTAAETNGSKSDPTSKDKTQRGAMIEEEKFILPDSAVLLLHGISRFQTLIACIPSITSEVSVSLLDYLKLFNSLSCQLVLGAGATRSSAGLKNINTKHLALASQALAFVITIIPYLREFVRRRPHMTGSGADGTLVEFDKVKRLYHDHQTSIHEKLVDIMSMRAGAHVRTMSGIDFEADSARQAASSYMETLVKETTMLQRALSKHMPEETVRLIMDPVWGSYREQWGRAFREAAVTTEDGKARLMRDAELFSAKLGKLEGASEVGVFLVEIVKEKTVA